MISLAARLKKQSPSMSYGNGWIMGENGKRWHPVLSRKQSESKIEGKSWLLKVMQCWVN